MVQDESRLPVPLEKKGGLVERKDPGQQKVLDTCLHSVAFMY